MKPLPPPRIDDLLAHANWLRRLSMHLARGEDPEDLVQDAWAAALRSPPDPARPAQPWLAEVLRNLVRGRGRARRRERAYEPRAADDRVVPSPEALLERAEAQRALAELVTALDEPYRSTVLLRYYEGLSGAQIAAAQGVPAGTVRWRLKEALRRLRAGMDARHGGARRAWTFVLAPTGPQSPDLAAIGLKGGVLMAMKAKVAALAVMAALIALVGGIAVWRLAANSKEHSEAPEGGFRGARPRVAAAPSREVLAAWQQGSSTRPAEINGVVLTPDGRAVPGALVALVVSASYDEMEDRTSLRPHASTTTVSDGAFRFRDVAPGLYLVTATAPGWIPAERLDVAVLPGDVVRSLELWLASGGVRLSGGVSDVGGGAIASAAVRILALGAGGRPDGARTFLAASEVDGRYQVTLPRGTYRVVVDAEGYAPGTLDLLLTVAQRRDFRLTPAARISGRVVDRRRDGPVVGAEVRLRSDAFKGGAQRSTTTDAAGAFSFTTVPPGSYWLAARAGDLTGQLARRVTVGPGGSTVDVLLEVSTGLGIAGQVKDGRGAPVANARVWTGSGADAFATTAGPDGAFRLEGLSPGRHAVQAGRDGHGTTRTTVILAHADRNDVVLVLPAEAQVVGRIVDRGGQPLAGASVTAIVAEGDALIESVSSSAVGRSDAQGQLLLRGLGPGELRVQAEHATAGRGIVGPYPLAAGEMRQVEVRIGRGGMIRGVTRWEDGEPARGVVVEGLQAGRPELSAMSDESGAYEVGPFPPGVVRMVARPEVSALGGGGGRRPVLLEAGRDLDGIDLRLPRHDQEISGVVFGPDGRPLADATVGASADHNGVSWRPYNKYARDEGGNYTALSAGDGTFRISHLPRGTFTVWATYGDLPEANAFRVPAGSRGVRVQLAGGATVAGQTVDANGAPVAAYTVHTMLSQSNDASAELKAARGYVQDTQFVQNATGRFEVRGLHEATYDLLVMTPDGRGGRLDGITLRAGEAKRDLRVRLTNPVTVRGRVVHAKGGEPLAGITVIAQLAMLKEQVSARTDTNGDFELPGIVPGAIVLSLRGSRESGLSKWHGVVVPAGAREHDVGRLVLGR